MANKFKIKLYENNDMNIELDGLQNQATGKYILDANVQCTLYKAGNPVSGGTWPVSMGYVQKTKGNYLGFLSKDLDLSAGDLVDVKIVAVGAGLTAEFKIENIKVRVREE